MQESTFFVHTRLSNIVKHGLHVCLHLGEGVLQVVVEVVQVEVEVSDAAAQRQQRVLVAGLLGQGDKVPNQEYRSVVPQKYLQADEVPAHPLVELLVLQAEDLHGHLAHLGQLGLGVSLTRWKTVHLQVHLLPHLTSNSNEYLRIDISLINIFILNFIKLHDISI